MEREPRLVIMTINSDNFPEDAYTVRLFVAGPWTFVERGSGVASGLWCILFYFQIFSLLRQDGYAGHPPSLEPPQVSSIVRASDNYWGHSLLDIQIQYQLRAF